MDDILVIRYHHFQAEHNLNILYHWRIEASSANAFFRILNRSGNKCPHCGTPEVSKHSLIRVMRLTVDDKPISAYHNIMNLG